VKVGEPRLGPDNRFITDHTVTFHKENLLLDGKERAKLPVSAKSFEVVYAKRRLSVTADQKQVLTVNLAQ